MGRLSGIVLGPQRHRKGPHKWTREAGQESQGDVTLKTGEERSRLVALKVEEAAMNQSLWGASKSWKRQKKGFFPAGASRQEHSPAITWIPAQWGPR